MSFHIRIENAVPRFRQFRFRHPIDWTIREGENWAVVGPNGAGKTLLCDILQGKIALGQGEVSVWRDGQRQEGPYGVVRSAAFRDIYSLTDCRQMYYQQRWNSSETDQSPLAASLLGEFPQEKIESYAGLFGIEHLLEKRIVFLSSGELRKFLITRILLHEPKVLVLDNPFIGLDAASRKALSGMLESMSRIKGLQTVMVLSSWKDIPGWVDRVLPVKDMMCLEPLSREDFLKDKELSDALFPEKYDPSSVFLPQGEPKQADYSRAVKMEQVKVAYGNRTILKDLDWEVKKGEKWALLGENGSGKSTLLSLVCADNPQAYANRIELFDRKRGSGESIWDIKKRIGYLSPEMHTYYLEDIPCAEIVASGFFDSVGLFRKCTAEQRTAAAEWLRLLNGESLAERSFLKISFGEQRLVLLARAMVKNPELLILDEPLHGLDEGKKELARGVIEAYCAQKDKTLILVTHYREEIPSCVTHFKTLEKTLPDRG